MRFNKQIFLKHFGLCINTWIILLSFNYFSVTNYWWAIKTICFYKRYVWLYWENRTTNLSGFSSVTFLLLQSLTCDFVGI